MVLKKLKSAINKLTGKSRQEVARPLAGGRIITVNLKDPYKQQEKVIHAPIKVNAPFTIEPSSTREVKLRKVEHKAHGSRARLKIKPIRKKKAKK